MTSSETTLPSWFGFVIGLVGGFAVSAGFIGFIIGMSFDGGLAGGRQVAQNPPSAPAALPPEPQAPTPSTPVTPVNAKTDHIRGNPNAKLSVIMYSDFECPFCKRHYPTMVQLLENNKDNVNWVYRHFPLSFHPAAEPAAEASECLSEIGGNDLFWKFVDKAFTVSDQLTPEQVQQIVKDLKVDETKYKECIDSGRYKQKIQDEMNSGVAAGVQGTPGSFVVVNATGEQQDVSGAVPLSNFQTVIDSMLGK